jgi:hypothetical protein
MFANWKEKNAERPFRQIIGPYSDATYNYVLKIVILKKCKKNLVNWQVHENLSATSDKT